MTIAAFQEALAVLLSLPKEERDRALVIAKLLSDGERVEFIRHLTELNGQIAATEKEQEQILSGMEEIVVGAEKKIARMDRSESESAAHTQEMAAVEQHFSQS